LKEDCCTCGKQGHKSVDCWKGKGKPVDGKKKAYTCGDNITRKFYRCNKMGHIAAEYLDKNQETGLVSN
jgi:hypothetical protein